MTSLDELMAVWRSQDSAPLHGVNETLLRLALRQDEAKLRAQRRMEDWITYGGSAALLAVMAVFLLLMIYPNDVTTGWDLAIPIVGACAALFMAVALYRGRSAQALRVQHFGDSLRDQLSRHITQLDYEAKNTRYPNALLFHGAVFIGATAILLAGMRMNSEPGAPFDDWEFIVSMIFVCVVGVACGVWEQHSAVKRDVAPRKERLEALLKELDAA